MKNEFDRLAESRYSCRQYHKKEVPAEELEQIMEDVRLAPSACNRQPWRFIVIGPNDQSGRQAVRDSYSRDWIEDAPVYVVACGVPSEAWVRPFDGENHVLVDVSIAVEHLCLSASSHGLGTCWICNFDPAVLRAGLGLDDALVPVAIIPVGYPADKPREKTRKPAEEVIVWR